ncbi:hypothetical protein BSKO_09696 [Bryopsis sp. KO-2023]|nr:hypothetical protein BSKO_09696 [Bryopsis sp. KO-2023]
MLPQLLEDRTVLTPLDSADTLEKRAIRRWNIAIVSGLIFAVLIVVVVLLTLGRGCKSCDDEVEALKCFYPLGGGETAGSLIQPRLSSGLCQNAFFKYTSKKGGRYWQDIEMVVTSIRKTLLAKERSVLLPNESQMVIFDIDETVLSNLDIYKRMGFGHFVQEDFDEWVLSSEAPAIPGMPSLLHDIWKTGASIGFITGRVEQLRNATAKNLKFAGFGEKCSESGTATTMCYEELILRGEGPHVDALTYKQEARAELSKEFQIVSSTGDQWSDLLGAPRPSIIFKMPNPFYYLP